MATEPAIQPNFPAPTAEILTAIETLLGVVAQLRNPIGGCPWDLEQTPKSLTPYIIEEAYETVDAIQSGNLDDIADELGDLLLQVVLQAQVAKDNGQFDLALVTQKITEKLIRRHPHVFADVIVNNSADVNANWNAIKAQEKPDEQQLSTQLKKYARSLPPLTAAMKISCKAAAVGFEWESMDGVWEKVQEELDELRNAIDHESVENQQSELGDVLFSLVQVARWQGLDPAEGLRGTNQRFVQRLQQMEEVADRPLSEYTLVELEELWAAAKRTLGQGRGIEN